MQIDQSWYRRLPGAPQREAAGGIVVRVEAGRPLIALVREGPAAGYILPKGRLEAGEGPAEAAAREIEEEAGLSDLELIAALGTRERYDYRKTHWKVTHYFLYRTGQEDGRPSDTERDYVLSWFPLDALPALFWPEQALLLAENRADIEAIAAGPG
jgi:ADP-ribose pyrophosphatase YjhB (NUDIX family)